MKNFANMTSSEIEAMTDEEFQAVSPFEKKGCYDCGWLEMYVGWWCMNKEAAEARGTKIPGCIKCPYWKPKWSLIDKKYHPKIDVIKTEVKADSPKKSLWAKLKQYLVN